MYGMNIPLDKKKYYTSGAEVYKRESDGSGTVLLHSTKGGVRSTVASLLNEEYYGNIEKKITMLHTTGEKLQEIITYAYNTLKPIIANGGQMSEDVYRIILQLSEMKKVMGNAEQVLRQKINN